MSKFQLNNLETIAVCTPNNSGRLIGKRIPIDRWAEIQNDGMLMPNFHLVTGIENKAQANMAVAGYATGFKNGILRPADKQLRPLPFEEGSALSMADVFDSDGSIVPEAPRTILNHQIERLNQIGLFAKCATELEFYLYRNSYRDAYSEGYKTLEPFYHLHGDNDILVSGFAENFLSHLRKSMQDTGIPVYATQGEGAPGQYEINFQHSDPLRAADNHVLFKHLTKQLASQTDMSVSFMAKIDPALAGSSCHVHISLSDKNDSSVVGSRQDGLSDIGQQFLAGLIKYAPDFMALYGPYMNSYKRLIPGSFAPSNCTWGWDNRSVMARVIGDQPLRFEFRTAGADANPYWVLSAMLASGIAGIKNKLVPPAAIQGNAYLSNAPQVPADLTEAVQAFSSSDTAMEAFGPQVFQHLLDLCKHERDAGRRAISDWEIARGFERA